MKSNYILLALFNILIILTPFAFNVHFDAHDDYLMLLFSSGVYTGTPESHLIYNNILYGILLSNLYSLIPNIEWYTIIQYFIQAICFNIFIYHILRLKIDKSYTILFSIIISLIAILLIIRPQYTFISSEVSLASIILFINKQSKKRYLFSFLLFITACLIRITGAFIPYLIIGPYLIFPFNRSKQNIKKIIYMGVLLITSFCMYQLDKSIYNSQEGWKNYITYNSYRQYIIDNPSKNKCIDYLTDSTKKQEYDLIINNNIFDGTILNTKDLRDIANNLQKYIFNNIKYNIYPYGRDYKQTGIFILCLILFFVSIIKLEKNDWPLILCLISFVFCNLFCMTRSTSKIYLCMALTIPLFFVLLTMFYKKYYQNKKIIHITCLIFIFFLIYRIDFTNKWNNKTINAMVPVKTILERNNEKKICYLNFALEGENAFHISNSIQGEKYFRLAWATNSPHNKKFHKDFSSFVNGMPLLISNKDIFVMDKIIALIKNQYGIITSYKIIDSCDKYLLVKIEKK